MTTRSPTSSSARLTSVGLVAAIFILLATQVCSEAYYGKLIGKLSELHHGVSGEVYAVDGRTLFIKDFTYDGEGPAAFFYAGNSKSPNGNGFRLRDERGTTNVLKRYRKKGITLTLPDGKSLNGIKWFSVWCDEFSVNFGDVKIPRGFDFPKPQKLAGLNGVHGVSSEPIVIVDAQTLLIPSFNYDGEAPDAKFWVGAGSSPSPQGIRVPNENGNVDPLRRYSHKTIVLTLPGDLTVHQLGHFGVWCEAFTVDFGHVQIPQNLNVPPSLKMLGVSPQSKLNCEVLEDRLAFEVRWAVAGDSIVVQLVGKLAAGQYMSFGVAENPDRSTMIRGDIAVAWVDQETLQGYAIDYYLQDKSQCSGGRGSCPDTRIQENTNSIRLLNAAMVNRYSIVTYQRPLKASDELDHPILTNRSQAIIWAIGPLNEREEVSFHTDYLKTDRFIDFGRAPIWNCPIPDQEQHRPHRENHEEESGDQEVTVTTRRPQRVQATPAPAAKTVAWEIPPITCDEPENGVFYAQMGPTGGKHGYPAITGHVGWGISWYINGLLIPEINVVRGRNYTFYVEAGDDPEIPARYHPFYITDDSIGGYQHKTPEERAKVKIYAGVRRQRGSVIPTGVGRLCNWVPDQEVDAGDFASFGAYQRTLTLQCDSGDPGFVEWTPDKNTPDTVYYQCFTHRYLGWKINVHDSCDLAEASASANHEVYADPNERLRPAGDLEGSASNVPLSSKVTPTAEFLQQHLHHPHRDYDLRYPHHSTTNPGKLSTPYTQLLTNANNNKNHYDRLQPSSSSSSSYGSEESYGPRYSYGTPGHGPMPHRHEVRVKETHHAHLDEDALQRHRYHHHHHHHQLAPIYREQSIGGTRLASYPVVQEIVGTDQEIQQSSNQQLSNLVADNPRPLNHGTKYTFPPGVAQILYSRPSHHYASNYHQQYHPLHHPHHHHQQLQHQSDQRTQLMIIKRPVLTRRPMLQSPHAMPSSSSATVLPLPSRPAFVERKKSVYRLPTPSYRITSEKLSQGTNSGTPQISKLRKIDSKQRNKFETKVSEVAGIDISERLLGPMKPARNTGFDPDSIVIEGGFKPIIRSVERSSDVAQRRLSERAPEANDPFTREKSNYRPIDSFEPVFVPSPPVPVAEALEMPKKMKKKPTNGKIRLDEIDDMEMAADRLDAYYLPPASNAKSDDPSPFSTSSLSAVLTTYDGKKLKDTGLARSISDIEEHSKTRLSSDLLSRTPQFGRFKGELPPPIPSDVRPADVAPPLPENHRFPATDLSLPELQTRRNTKLTLVERTKRSARGGYTTFVRNDRGNSSSTVHDTERDATTTLVGSGHATMVNFGYVLLIALCCYII